MVMIIATEVEVEVKDNRQKCRAVELTARHIDFGGINEKINLH